MFSVHYAYAVAQGYRGEDKALEMDRKEGRGFWCAQEGGNLEKLTSKIICFFFNLKK